MEFKSEYRIEKEKLDAKVYDEFVKLAQPGQSLGAIGRHLMKKYGFHSPTTIWQIRKREEKRRAALAQ